MGCTDGETLFCRPSPIKTSKARNQKWCEGGTEKRGEELRFLLSRTESECGSLRVCVRTYKGAWI